MSRVGRFGSTSTTTNDPAENGLLLRVSIDDGNYMVRDFVGLRYGFAPVLLHAVEAWANDVEWMVTETEDKLGDPLLSEARAYRRALHRRAA